MTTWAAPIVWANGAVTAANMNTISSNSNFLKGALDILTGSSTADTGVTMNLNLTRATDVTAFRAQISADTQPRVDVRAGGGIYFGSGAAVSDVNLTRSAASTLLLGATGTATLALGNADTTLYRSAAGIMEMPNNVQHRGIATVGNGNDIKFAGKMAADTVARWSVSADGTHLWSPGIDVPDISMFRSAFGTVTFNNLVRGGHGIGTWVVAGQPSDATFAASVPGLVPVSGTLIVDSTNNKLWARVGTTWKGVVLV